MPKVCDACKNKNEDDNEIVENLCKNDFGKYEGDTLIENWGLCSLIAIIISVVRKEVVVSFNWQMHLSFYFNSGS